MTNAQRFISSHPEIFSQSEDNNYRLLHRLPIYRPENIDKDGRHKNPALAGPFDWDICQGDRCGVYCEIQYWYGYTIPLCRRCTKELMGE